MDNFLAKQVATESPVQFATGTERNSCFFVFFVFLHDFKKELKRN